MLNIIKYGTSDSSTNVKFWNSWGLLSKRFTARILASASFFLLYKKENPYNIRIFQPLTLTVLRKDISQLVPLKLCFDLVLISLVCFSYILSRDVNNE